MCGRASGSHVAPDYMVRPLDFDWHDLAGRRIVVVDNNAATGATLAHLAHQLTAVPRLRADLFLDYVVTALGPLADADFAAQGYAATRIGPYARAEPQTSLKRHVVRAIAQGLRAPEGLA